MPGKNPAILYYPLDFDRDTATLSNAAVGAWQRLLNAMHWSSPRGQFTGDWSDYAKVLRCGVEEARQLVREIIDRKVCDTRSAEGGRLTVICRRMQREEHEREAQRRRKAAQRERARQRQRRFRDGGPGGGDATDHADAQVTVSRPCHAPVTPLSRSCHAENRQGVTPDVTPGNDNSNRDLREGHGNGHANVPRPSSYSYSSPSPTPPMREGAAAAASPSELAPSELRRRRDMRNRAMRDPTGLDAVVDLDAQSPEEAAEAKAQADAMGYARAWISAECPNLASYRNVSDFAWLVRTLGKKEASARVMMALCDRNVRNAIAYVARAVSDDAEQARRERERVERLNRMADGPWEQ